MNAYDGSRSFHPGGVCRLPDGRRDAGLCRLRVRHVSV